MRVALCAQCRRPFEKDQMELPFCSRACRTAWVRWLDAERACYAVAGR